MRIPACDKAAFDASKDSSASSGQACRGGNHDPALATAATLLALQRSAGNAAVTRMLAAGHSAGPGHEDVHVQRARVHEVLRSPGRPLDAPLREEMENRLGADFSDVRVHSDSLAQRSAAESGAGRTPRAAMWSSRAAGRTSTLSPTSSPMSSSSGRGRSRGRTWARGCWSATPATALSGRLRQTRVGSWPVRHPYSVPPARSTGHSRRCPASGLSSSARGPMSSVPRCRPTRRVPGAFGAAHNADSGAAGPGGGAGASGHRRIR